MQPVLTKTVILQKEKAKVTIIPKAEKITEAKTEIKTEAVVQAKAATATITATTTTKTTTPTVATITTAAIETKVLLTKRKTQVCLYL